MRKTRQRLSNTGASGQDCGGAVFLISEGITPVASVTEGCETSRKTLAIPIGKETGKVGTLYLGPRRDGTSYTEAETILLEGVAESLWRVQGMSAA